MILKSLEENADLKERIIEEIKRGMFKDFLNPQLTFEQNLEKPAFMVWWQRPTMFQV